MTDAMEAVGQNVHQEAADELVSSVAHDILAAVATIIFIGEGGLTVLTATSLELAIAAQWVSRAR